MMRDVQDDYDAWFRYAFSTEDPHQDVCDYDFASADDDFGPSTAFKIAKICHFLDREHGKYWYSTGTFMFKTWMGMVKFGKAHPAIAARIRKVVVPTVSPFRIVGINYETNPYHREAVGTPPTLDTLCSEQPVPTCFREDISFNIIERLGTIHVHPRCYNHKVTERGPISIINTVRPTIVKKGGFTFKVHKAYEIMTWRTTLNTQKYYCSSLPQEAWNDGTIVPDPEHLNYWKVSLKK